MIRPLAPDTQTHVFVRYEDGGAREVWRVWSPSKCLLDGTCRDGCQQPKSYKLKCETRGQPWHWREVSVAAIKQSTEAAAHPTAMGLATQAE